MFVVPNIGVVVEYACSDNIQEVVICYVVSGEKQPCFGRSIGGKGGKSGDVFEVAD